MWVVAFKTQRILELVSFVWHSFCIKLSFAVIYLIKVHFLCYSCLFWQPYIVLKESDKLPWCWIYSSCSIVHHQLGSFPFFSFHSCFAKTFRWDKSTSSLYYNKLTEHFHSYFGIVQIFRMANTMCYTYCVQPWSHFTFWPESTAL